MGIPGQVIAATAFAAGACGWLAASAALAQRKRTRRIRACIVSLDADQVVRGTTLPLVLHWARTAASRSGKDKGARQAAVLPAAFAQRFEAKIRMAGLDHEITVAGLSHALLCTAAFLALAGLVLGAAFSVPAMVAGSVAGCCAAPLWATRALDQVARARSRALDAHLSEAIEVMCLGLRAGLSFDRALELYCSSFSSVLSAELLRAMRAWQAGIATREKAPQNLASSYDSHVLKRMVDGVVRSMRFGTPLADTLESLAAEARHAHKAAVQEQVMKAPVKMMLPIGLLILPSMLLLVMGPILLDLMGGL